MRDASGALLFSQHGWADTNRKMLALGHAVAPPGATVVAPDLGYFKTWRRFEPLVETVEAAAAPYLSGESGAPSPPSGPVYVVGHSLGGLLWLTILDRRPEWRRRVTALVLLGCPVRGADLAAILDSQGWTIGRDLALDRGALAAGIAAGIPTLSVAGDLILASDGTITCRSAVVAGARFVCLPRESHAGMLRSAPVRRLVRAFVADPHPPPTDPRPVVDRLRAVPGVSGLPVGDPPGDRLAVLFHDGATLRWRFPPFGDVRLALAGGWGDRLWSGQAPRRAVPALREAFRDLARHPGALTGGPDGDRAGTRWGSDWPDWPDWPD